MWHGSYQSNVIILCKTISYMKLTCATGEGVRTYQLFLGQFISYWSNQILKTLLWASWYHSLWPCFLTSVTTFVCFLHRMQKCNQNKTANNVNSTFLVVSEIFNFILVARTCFLCVPLWQRVTQKAKHDFLNFL